MERRGEEKNLCLRIDKQDEPMQWRSSSGPQMGVWAEEKLVPNSYPGPDGLAPKSCHLGCHMRWMSVWASPKYEALSPNWWNQAILLAQILRLQGGPLSGPKNKVALMQRNWRSRVLDLGRLVRSIDHTYEVVPRVKRVLCMKGMWASAIEGNWGLQVIILQCWGL